MLDQTLLRVPIVIDNLRTFRLAKGFEPNLNKIFLGFGTRNVFLSSAKKNFQNKIKKLKKYPKYYLKTEKRKTKTSTISLLR